MLNQTKLIHDGDFDTLIILDAMRYDIFKQLNKIPGKLYKAKSPASHTWEWLNKTFPDKYPWTYFTAHPHITEKELPHRWDGSKHFDKVVPIYMKCWNDELGTVHPRDVCKVVGTSRYDKAIVHFIQPHGPWIGRNKLLNPWTLEQHQTHNMMADWVMNKLQMYPTKFRILYKDNVRLVLDTIQKNLKLFKGKVVITADHGEMLGEKGLYLHKSDFPKWADSLLKTVPFFVVDKDNV